MSEISSGKLASFPSTHKGDIHGMCNLLRLCISISCIPPCSDVSHFVVVVLLCYLCCCHLRSVPSSNLVSSPEQETPLHKAANWDRVGAVDYLIQAGADVNIKNNFGVSEKDYTTNCGLIHQR